MHKPKRRIEKITKRTLTKHLKSHLSYWKTEIVLEESIGFKEDTIAKLSYLSNLKSWKRSEIVYLIEYFSRVPNLVDLETPNYFPKAILNKCNGILSFLKKVA